MGTCKSKQKLKDPDEAPYGFKDGNKNDIDIDCEKHFTEEVCNNNHSEEKKSITVNIKADKVSIGGTSGEHFKFFKEEIKNDKDECSRVLKQPLLKEVYMPSDSTTDGEIVTAKVLSESCLKIKPEIETMKPHFGGTGSVELDVDGAFSMQKELNSILDEDIGKTLVRPSSSGSQTCDFSIISIRSPSEGTDESSVQVKSGFDQIDESNPQRSGCIQSKSVIKSLVGQGSKNIRSSKKLEEASIDYGSCGESKRENDVLVRNGGSLGDESEDGNTNVLVPANTSTQNNYETNMGQSIEAGIDMVSDSNGQAHNMGQSMEAGIGMTSASNGQAHNILQNDISDEIEGEARNPEVSNTDHFPSQSDHHDDDDDSRSQVPSGASTVTSVETSALFGSGHSSGPRPNETDVNSNDDVEPDAEMAREDDGLLAPPGEDHDTIIKDKMKNGERTIEAMKIISIDIGQYSMDRNLNIALEGDDSVKIVNGQEIGSTARHLASQVKEIAVSCF